MKNILVADIGGTNSRFAHFIRNQGGELTVAGTQWYKTIDYSSFTQLVEQLKVCKFTLEPEEADIVVIAIAGPVDDGKYSSPPFIAWDIDISSAQKDFGFNKCFLINDFIAQAFACRSPIAESAEEILSGRFVPNEPVVVLGAGTALGIATLVPNNESGFIAIPSEGGHTNIPFASKRECEFQEFLLKELGEPYVTYNHIVSGRGISYIHRYLTGERLEPEDIALKFHGDSETLEWSARLYGRACRNFALGNLARGGVYVTGGVAAKLPKLLTHNAFRNEFYNSSTMSDILKQIPVYLIRDEDSGLWGAAYFGLQYLKENKCL